MILTPRPFKGKIICLEYEQNLTHYFGTTILTRNFCVINVNFSLKLYLKKLNELLSKVSKLRI